MDLVPSINLTVYLQKSAMSMTGSWFLSWITTSRGNRSLIVFPPMQKTWSWVGLFVALALASGCKKGEGAACFDRSECAEGLACVGEALQRCEKCEGLDLCKVNGQCTAKDGACVAASDEECKKSHACKGLGPCTAKNGVCVVGSDADCKQSEACAKEKF